MPDIDGGFSLFTWLTEKSTSFDSCDLPRVVTHFGRQSDASVCDVGHSANVALPSDAEAWIKLVSATPGPPSNASVAGHPQRSGWGVRRDHGGISQHIG
jgi:hypothetical protein